MGKEELLLAERLKELRKKNGYTLDELASFYYNFAKMEKPYTSTTIYCWESGRAVPKTLEIPSLAKFYGVSLQNLYKLTTKKESFSDPDGIYADKDILLQRITHNLTALREYNHLTKKTFKAEYDKFCDFESNTRGIQSIVCWEQGKYAPSPLNMKNLSLFYGIRMDTLYGLERLTLDPKYAIHKSEFTDAADNKE